MYRQFLPIFLKRVGSIASVLGQSVQRGEPVHVAEVQIQNVIISNFYPANNIMDPATESHLKEILNDLHKDAHYKTTLKIAMDSAAKRIPLLTNVSIAINTHLGGSLGTRSTRKQLRSSC